jgi:predicted PurR-regulated permease PerM
MSPLVHRTLRIALAVFTTLAGVALLWQFGIAVFLFLLSLVTASALRPSILALKRRGLSHRAALVSSYGFLVLTIAGVLILFTQPFLNDLQQFADDFVTGYDRIKMEWPRGGTLFQRSLADQLPPSENFYAALSSEEGIASVLQVLGAAQNVLSGLVQVGIIIVLGIYWGADGNRFEQFTLTLVPEAHHERALELWDSVEREMGGLVRGEVIQSLLAGLFLGIAFLVMGVPYPTLLAVWVAVVRLVPWFGSILAILPPLVAIIAGAPVPGISAGVWRTSCCCSGSCSGSGSGRCPPLSVRCKFRFQRA